MGGLPNDVRTHFMMSGDKGKEVLSKLLLYNINNNNDFQEKGFLS